MAKQGFVAGLIMLIVLSALSVVYSSHQSRQLFNEWQLLQKEAYRLDEDWGRLLLEHSTWAAHDRVERLASERLMMTPPVNEALQLVKVNAKED
ncbi:cell division protein FtsL [Litorivivens sp.]|uniref:cell division protein FtsL n=1 Tax=Litorivivens sp. TaxID=2020868 RepID=UPI0035625067